MRVREATNLLWEEELWKDSSETRGAEAECSDAATSVLGRRLEVGYSLEENADLELVVCRGHYERILGYIDSGQRK